MRGIAFLIASRASAGGAPAPRRPAARTSSRVAPRPGGAPAPRRPAARTSLAIQLHDELLGHRDLDVVTQRQAPDDTLLLVGVEVQPRRHLTAAGIDVVVD